MMGPPVSHADVSADGAVLARPGQLIAVLLAAGSANATLILYDNPAAASGTVLCKLAALANDSVSFTPPVGISAGGGIFADIEGTGANATVLYA
jgi:hypothetical protein